MQLRWTPNWSVSALHAAACISEFRNQVLDSSLVDSLGEFTESIDRWILAMDCPMPSTFWQILIATAADIESNFELADITMRKCGRPMDASGVSVLAGRITDIEAAFKQLYPKFIDQIRYRSRPLEEQWLGYGGGLTAHIGRLTDKNLLVHEARVVPVQPVMGGFGFAHLPNNLVRIEAVLTNPLAELPEVVRLAWLLAQLQLEAPIFSDGLGKQKLQFIAPLAMLPATLAAAQVVELSPCTNEIAALAMEHWNIPIPVERSISGDIVPMLMDWWETYLQTKSSWPIALQALEKILEL